MDRMGNAVFFGKDRMVFLTESCHWKFVHSTTMTFATTADILLYDKAIWYWASQTLPIRDYLGFVRLRKENSRTIASSIPGYSTHCEVKYLSPLINWEEI